jgi:hypothetical protein
VDFSANDAALERMWNNSLGADSTTAYCTRAAANVTAGVGYTIVVLEAGAAYAITDIGVVPLSALGAQARLEITVLAATGSAAPVLARPNACPPEGIAASPSAFASQMSPAEAARYQAYWQRYAPRHLPPGTNRLDWCRVSGRTGRIEMSRVIYDQYGRQHYRVDFTDHMRPQSHSNPHLHEYLYGPGCNPREIIHNLDRR